MSIQTVDDSYSRTDTVPLDWEELKLADVCSRITTGKLDANAMVTNGLYPFFTCAREVYRINRYSFETEALLVSGNGANVGYIHYYNGKFDAYQRTYVISGFLRNIQFIRNSLEHNLAARILTEARAGNTPYITMDTLTQMPLLIPRSDLEAEGISRAIADAAALITTLERLIAKKQAIKQGMMQELLTGNKELCATLSDISGFITKGATPTTYGFDWQSSGVPFLRSECVADWGLDLRQSMYISEAANQVLRRSQVKDGDLLMTITGNVGRVIRLRVLGTANINQHIARIRINDSRFDAGYVYHYLSRRAMRAYYESIVTGQAYPQISLKQVRDTKVFAPRLEQQRAIAAALDDADSAVAALERLHAKYQTIMQGMMQELLTGRTRLHVAEAAS